MEIKDKILLGDNLDIMSKLSSNTYDLIFADPPYYLQLNKDLERPDGSDVDGVFDDWDKFSSFEEYDSYCIKWLGECKRLLKDDGSIWVIGSYHNIFRLGKIIQDLDFWILNDVIWIKSNPMPNFKGTRFCNAHETLIWASKSKKSKFTFNYKTMKSFNEDLQMRSDWYIPICQGEERLKDENGNKIHSTQKPESLLKRIILATTKPGDFILDPFSGSGTTASISKLLNRNYTGIEKEEKYYIESLKRLENIIPMKESDINLNLEVKPPKIPIGELISSGILLPNTEIYTPDKKQKFNINLDGTITWNDNYYSIHKLGAILKNAKSCNGWDYWLINYNDEWYKLDYLRQIYIKKYL